jgi:hypothetical protein
MARIAGTSHRACVEVPPCPDRHGHRRMRDRRPGWGRRTRGRQPRLRTDVKRQRCSGVRRWWSVVKRRGLVGRHLGPPGTVMSSPRASAFRRCRLHTKPPGFPGAVGVSLGLKGVGDVVWAGLPFGRRPGVSSQPPEGSRVLDTGREGTGAWKVPRPCSCGLPTPVGVGSPLTKVVSHQRRCRRQG